MDEAHQQAAELHAQAAQRHRTAAEHNEKGHLDQATYHALRPMEYSNKAYKLASEAHQKSGRIGAL